MSVINRFMNYFGLQDEEEVVEREKVAPQMEEPEHEFETSPFEARKHSKSSNSNIVSIHSQKNVRVVLNEPRSFEEAQEIADHLRARRGVVVNLQRVPNDVAKRIFDFLLGTLYAVSGTMNRIGPGIFFCAPENVEIQGTISELLVDEQDYKRMR
ncbi:cell division protein SepF [Paenibacillus kobensis]|uniref:cell division protein SepF n=1 Tax=Paenibacillus kobensis TaxID=59841 RepID=UPI000FD9DD2E|nr:cell division protein SepF [Paenibacillus kobensis]